MRRAFSEPSDDLVRLIAKRLHDGQVNEGVRERFRSAITIAMTSLIRDGVQERLENAISQGEPEAGVIASPSTESEVETTPEEIDGFNILRAICASKVAPERIVMRDAKSYCAVLLDNNNRRPIARMYFNSPTSRNLAIMVGKEENRVPVSKPVEIYQHAKSLLQRVSELTDDAT